MRTSQILLVLLFLQLVAFPPEAFAEGEPADTASGKTRCPVCGMFVAKYPNWLAQIQFDSPAGEEFFDGVKDMMAFYFSPGQYGGRSREVIRLMFVKDYYSLRWLDAKEAFYVVGSDVYGPMGHELIPFTTRAAAESFRKDHHGTAILTFAEITPEFIESLRSGQKMR